MKSGTTISWQALFAFSMALSMLTFGVLLFIQGVAWIALNKLSRPFFLIPGELTYYWLDNKGNRVVHTRQATGSFANNQSTQRKGAFDQVYRSFEN